jgi:hypothetical protein
LSGCSKTPRIGLGVCLPRFDRESTGGIGGCFSGCLFSYLLRFAATFCGID